MKHLFKYLFVLIGLLFLPLEAELHCPAENGWTISQLLDTALKNNPDTRAAWWNAQRAAAAVGSAKSAYYPEINFNANVKHGRDFKFTNGPDVNYTILEASVILRLLLADFGERSASVEMSKMALLAAGWQTEWTIQKVIAQVLENGYKTLYAQDTLEALQTSLEDARAMLDSATKLNAAGLSPISDVYSSQAALAQLQIEVTGQRSQLEIQRAMLATVLGLEAGTNLKLSRLNALQVPEQQLSELIALAKSQRQDLMAKRARHAELLAQQKKVNAQYYPKLSLSGYGSGEHAVNDKAHGAHFQVALNLDFPLFTGFDAMYQKRMAYADVKISSEELVRLELEIALEVFTQSSNVQAYKEMLQYARVNLDSAQAAYEGVLEKFKAGKEGIAEISIALRQLVSARVRYSEIHSGYLVAIANLAFATGTLCPYMEAS